MVKTDKKMRERESRTTRKNNPFRLTVHPVSSSSHSLPKPSLLKIPHAITSTLRGVRPLPYSGEVGVETEVSFNSISVLTAAFCLVLITNAMTKAVTTMPIAVPAASSIQLNDASSASSTALLPSPGALSFPLVDFLPSFPLAVVLSSSSPCFPSLEPLALADLASMPFESLLPLASLLIPLESLLPFASFDPLPFDPPIMFGFLHSQH